MLRCLLIEPGRVELHESPIPEPAEGELLIKVRAALTCGTDLKAYLRGHPVIPMPGPFGHEFSGIVAARGGGVRRFREGDGVMSVHTAPCLACAYCRKGAYNLCENIMSTKVMGAFGEYVLLPRHIVSQNVYIKPHEIDFEEAALLEPLSCVVHGVEPLRIRRGSTALVIGAGPIGLMHVMLLGDRGAVTATVDINHERLLTAKALGAATFAPEETGKAMEELTGGMGFDYVFECTGRPEVWESSVYSLRRGGTLVLFGGCPSGTKVIYDTHRLHYDEITLKGDFHFTPSDVNKAFELLAGGGLMTSALISGRFGLKEIQSAFEALKAGSGIKYAIIP